MSLRDDVTALLTDALAAEELEAVGDIGRLLAAPPKAEMGDLAFPCFALAKLRKAPPPKIAAALAEAIQPAGAVSRIQAFGPYLNFFADPCAELDALAKSLADHSFFQALKTDRPTRVMVEFSQPNTHKVFHVGHLRNVTLGDCLTRVLRARGHEVIAANYYGDFGIDVAKCLWWLRNHPEEQAPTEHRLAWLGRAYVNATNALAEAKERSEEEGVAVAADIREVLRGMEDGDEEITALYRETRQWCLDAFHTLYERMGVEFDVEFFESEVEEAGQAIVDDYLERGVFEVGERGAIICRLDEEKLVPALVRKSDGASLYMTWDLALAREKFERFGIERSLYVVASEQNFHFQQLFATLRKMGYKRAEDCRHVSYALVMLPEGKMSSRSGTMVPLHELEATVTEAIRAKARVDDRTSEWTDEQWGDTIERVMVASLKYGMLRIANNRTVVFDVDAWTNPEGDTGAYLLYGLARMSGIFRKAGDVTVDLAAGLQGVEGFGEEGERNLLNHLQAFPRVVARVEEGCDAAPLADYLYNGVKAFSRFYNQCPVLKAEPALRDARLVLVKVTETIFRKACELLGLPTVEAM